VAFLIIGTGPREDFPMIQGPAGLDEGFLSVDDQKISVARGTPALLAAALLTAQVLGIEAPAALLVGDIGSGKGCKKLYEHMVKEIRQREENLLVFHYLQPDLDWHNKILLGLEEKEKMPLLVADAGYMYVAKMSGYAAVYDLFTPDAGEMAFLADERAPHPFYTRGFLLSDETRVPELISRAYANENASKYLLVKGRHDYIACETGILATVSEPCEEAMEPIGGTGDSLTGIAAALIAAGHPIPQAAELAAKANRLMGKLARPTPAFSIADLLPFLTRALEMVLE
jgi:NAD(P)H-hydrate repair Nnr-like enzyme with NAD(P)H-hydrate dehydratase domain